MYPAIFVRVKDLHSHVGTVERVASAMRDRRVPLTEVNKFRYQANNALNRDELMAIISKWVDTDKETI